MASRPRMAGGLLVIAVIAAAVLAGMRYEVVEAVRDRLATDYTVGDAQFSAPGLFVWPRLTKQGALSSCDLCVDPGLPGITAEYGVLRSDPGITTFIANYPKLAFSPDDVHLPQVAWILQWPLSDFCRGYGPPPHIKKCASYELIDDATGWILDAGQNPAS
jgi:hypothetical protein